MHPGIDRQIEKLALQPLPGEQYEFAEWGKSQGIFNSQAPIDAWHNALDNKNIADAILDRLIHSAPLET